MRFIDTGDWHVRPDRPRCRRDVDWMGTQRRVLEAIRDEALLRKAAVLAAGDVFHRGVVNPETMRMLMDVFIGSGVEVYIMAGNHDLPYHSWGQERDSSFGLLWAMTRIPGSPFRSMDELKINWGHFGAQPHRTDSDIQVEHRLTFKSDNDMPPNVEATTAKQLLEEFPSIRWMLTSDNHHSFHYRWGERHVVNPGCIVRQTADLKDYAPIAYYVDTDLGTVEEIALPDSDEMVTDAYLKEEADRDHRIESFVSSVAEAGTVTLSFEDNVEAAVRSTTLDPYVVQIIEELMTQGRAK